MEQNAYRIQGGIINNECTGRKLGILEGKQAVCYPGFEEQLTGAEVLKQEVARQDNVTTSRGLGTAIPFALDLITQLYGEEKAEEIRKSIIFQAEI